jgi:hypothetical protein
MADDSLISDLLVLGFFDKDKKSPDKPLPKKIQKEIIGKIWLWCIAFVLFYMAVCLIALALK